MDKDNINKLDPDENIVVRMGGKVYIYEKGSPEWKDWESIPSYDDAEMVYSLMTGEYVDEFKARIPEYITNIIVEELHPASESSKLLNEAYEIYNNLFSDSRDGHADDVSGMGTLFENFYDLVHNIVCTFYKVAFYSQSKEAYCLDEIQCRKDYECMIRKLLCYKDKVSNDADRRNIDRLIFIFNEQIKLFYDRAIEYGTYFGNWKSYNTD